jgi:hypothetical protein
MSYNERSGCNDCVCKYCKRNKKCNELDQRCDKCKKRNFKQILYDHLLCPEFTQKGK